MAKVIAHVIGGSAKELDAQTVADLKVLLKLSNYSATINGESASDDQLLEQDDMVQFAPQVKGA